MEKIQKEIAVREGDPNEGRFFIRDSSGMDSGA